MPNMSTQTDIGILLAHLMREFQRDLYQALHAQGFNDITPRHGAVFAYLDPDGTRASVLSRRSGVHKQIMGNLIDELENLGYVARVPDPADRRAKLVKPTQKGHAQRIAAHDIRNAIEARYRGTLGNHAYEALLASIATLTEAFGTSGNDPARESN